MIGYIRICRPGSVIGPQQHYLKEMEQKCWRMGDQHRAQLQAQNLRVHNGLGEPSSVDYGDEEGDAGGGSKTSPMKPMRSGEIPLSPPHNSRCAAPHPMAKTSVGVYSFPTWVAP